MHQLLPTPLPLVAHLSLDFALSSLHLLIRCGDRFVAPQPDTVHLRSRSKRTSRSPPSVLDSTSSSQQLSSLPYQLIIHHPVIYLPTPALPTTCDDSCCPHDDAGHDDGRARRPASATAAEANGGAEQRSGRHQQGHISSAVLFCAVPRLTLVASHLFSDPVFLLYCSLRCVGCVSVVVSVSVCLRLCVSPRHRMRILPVRRCQVL